jgi:hypothetical protein
MVGWKIFVSDIQKPIESEPKKRNGCHQITNLNKITNKIYYGYECCIRLNVGINLRNFSVFMQAGFTLVETGFTRSKNTGNIMKI